MNQLARWFVPPVIGFTAGCLSVVLAPIVASSPLPDPDKMLALLERQQLLLEGDATLMEEQCPSGAFRALPSGYLAHCGENRSWHKYGQ